MSKNVNFIKENEKREILEILLSTGGDFAEVFMEDTVTEVIEMVLGKITRTDVSKISGAAIRLVKDGVQVNCATSDYSVENLRKIASDLASSFIGEKQTALVPFRKIAIPEHVSVKRQCNGDNVEEIALMKQVTAGAKDASDKIVQIQTSFWKKIQDMAVFASDGTDASDHRNNMRLGCVAVAREGNNMQNASDSYGRNQGMEMFDGFDAYAFGNEIAKEAVVMLDAIDMPGGDIPVVIDNGFGGVILHEACVHGLEATSVAKGMSVFCGKVGQKIASDIVNAVDEGVTAGEWGSINIDDEGTVCQNRVLVKDGILKGYLVDKLNSKIMNHPITGSSRRESYKYRTTSRMTNTYFLPGKDKFEDIISSVKYGLYAKKMGGGSVQPATGEFNFAVNVGYLIEDGKITKPVKGATLVGTGKDVLLRIEMIADNLAHAAGMCGSMSGSIPTNVGQPTIKVSHMTVGGKGGN